MVMFKIVTTPLIEAMKGEKRGEGNDFVNWVALRK